ncbi:MAG: DNA-binding protein [Thermoleophilia bacterium]|nr:DNA-binding protein [Thermoleophilia bacterium]
MILVSRIVTALILGIAGFQLGDSTRLAQRLPGYAEIALNFGILILIGVLAGWVVGGLLGKLLERMIGSFNERASDRSGSELVVGAIGLIVGLSISALLSLPVSQLEPIGPFLLLPMTLIIAYVAAELAAAKHRDILRLFGVRVEGDGARGKLLDTSALIDGRVADVAMSGFLEGELVVPVFVLEELQHIADSSDDVRRARGRRGLEVVTRLRKAKRLSTVDEDPTEIQQVDSKLVRLAAKHGWCIVTNDVALSKVASAQAVAVLNVNELANALKPEFVPGERFELKVVREGKEAGQGVGYLDDGTMVIVDQGGDAIGGTVEVEVSSMLQSPTGKLVFTRLSGAAAR